jgi:predicted amidohydrolase YtcJ
VTGVEAQPGSAGSRPRAFADRAIVGARIRTLDPARPLAEAVALRGGTIVAVGDEAAVRAHCDGATELIDGRGSTVVAGLVDAHMHPLWAAEFAQGAELAGSGELAELGARLRRERVARGGDPQAVVRGWGAEYALFADGGLDGALLERLAGGPALITFFDCHTHLATPSVLARAGIHGAEPFADNSQIVCREDGSPTGELREFEAYDRVAASLPALAPGEALERVAVTFERMSAAGLAGAHVMDGSAATLDVLRELEAADRLTARLVVPVWVKPGMDDDELEALLALRHERGRLWRGSVAKFFIDGVVETGTSWLEEPDSSGEGRLPLWEDPQRYAATVARFAAAGFQCVTHAIGDRAVRCALDAYRAAGAAPGVRHRIEHAESLPDGHLARIVAEDVILSMQPIHLQWRRPDGSDDWARRLGPARTGRAFRFADALAAGAVVALGSDWPIADFDPLRGMAWARLRREPGQPGRAAVEPRQVLDGDAALAGYTTAAAAAVGEQRVAGRIAPGMRADLTVLDGDPVTIPADELPGVAVRATIVDGRTVHAA